MYNTNKEIPSLSQVRREERDKKEIILDTQAKELLFNAIKFYDENYPNSTQDNEWKWSKVEVKIGNKTLDEELGKLSESDFSVIFEILQYYHDERQMPRIEQHQLRNRIIGKIKRLDKSGEFLDKLYELYTKQKDLNKEINELENSLNIEREKTEKRLEKKPKKTTVEVTCEICGKICKSEAGKTSHLRVHSDKKNE